MATVAGTITHDTIDSRPEQSGSPVARAIDRWIYVFMAASFIVIALVGFIPDAIRQTAAIKTGARPPFSPYVHMHAALMTSFLLLLLTQTTLMATGRRELHQRLGRLAAVLVPAMIIVWLAVIRVLYQSAWTAAHTGPPQFRAGLLQALPFLDGLVAGVIGKSLLFALLIVLALRARRTDAGFHKRMMILATVAIMTAAIVRIRWLPNIPLGGASADLYTILIASPMFTWDLIRSRRVHRAYIIWFAAYVSLVAAVDVLSASQWWHATAPRLMGV